MRFIIKEFPAEEIALSLRSSSHENVEKAGGMIRVESEVNKGSTFIVEMPLPGLDQVSSRNLPMQTISNGSSLNAIIGSMELEKRVARAAIPDREWLQIEIQLDLNSIIKEISFRAFGCHSLLESCAKFTQNSKGLNLRDLNWNGLNHWDILIEEVVLKLKGIFQLPITEEELCHCRKIPTVKVDNAIVMGALTPEKVRAWTSASSGCGTCRPNVEKLISYRTGKVS